MPDDEELMKFDEFAKILRDYVEEYIKGIEESPTIKLDDGRYKW